MGENLGCTRQYRLPQGKSASTEPSRVWSLEAPPQPPQVEHKRARARPPFIRAASATRAGAGGIAEIGEVAATSDAARRTPFQK